MQTQIQFPHSPRVIESGLPHGLWNRLIHVVDAHCRFLLTTHIKPDGDGIGSQLAIAYFLEKIGKQVWIVNDSPLHSAYHFLDPLRLIKSFDELKPALERYSPEVIFIVDIASTSRLGGMEGYVLGSDALTICLDHHHPSGDEVSDLSLIDTEASATGELVYQLVRRWPMELTQELALPLYVSLLTDTGCFSHTNSSPRVHRIAAELLETGISHSEIYRNLFQRSSLARYRMAAHLMLSLEMSEEGKLAWLQVSREEMARFGVTADEMACFSETPRELESVEVVLFFQEIEGGEVKLSLRSKGRANVLEIAKKLHGGGHQHAAGAKLRGSLGDALRRAVPVAAAMLSVQMDLPVTLPAIFRRSS